MGFKAAFQSHRNLSMVCIWSCARRRYPLPIVRNTSYLQNQTQYKKQCWSNDRSKNPSQLSPLFLFFLGAAFCAVELTSAFPYFGFLAILTTYNLTFPLVIVFLIIYDLIYVLPLILLYFAYNKLQGTAIIKKIESILSKVAAYIVPVVVTLLGILLLYYGIYSLI